MSRVADTAAQRLLRFHERYFDAVASARKTLTVRWNESHTTGTALAYFEHADRTTLPVDITSVETHRLSELTAQTLRLKTDSGLLGYVSNLRDRYPGMPEDAQVDVVTFRLSAVNI
ncbi:ASCH domain-containing protein [Brevibacterium marinum]|uniref:ASCH domain-containing protein n=1 Tax=Brevibacterium marinum TaxID=418643 RepID=UPI00315879E0